MSQIEGVIPIADGVDVEGIQRTVAADLRQMAKSDVTIGDGVVRFAIGSGRWWRSGLPMDMVDSGEIKFNDRRRELAFTLSMRRTDIGCLAVSALMGVGIIVLLHGPIWFGLIASVGSFFWLWIGNHLATEHKVRRYLLRLASRAA